MQGTPENERKPVIDSAGAVEAAQMLTCTEIDRLFRLRHGTARAAAAAGEIRCRVQPRGGKTSYLIALSDARDAWGPR
jgi:hypothetical protein